MTYRFAGDVPPPALAHLRNERCWCSWDYRWKGRKWTKPPINPHTGRNGSSTDPRTWGTFDEVLAGMRRHKLAGIGLVLEAAGLIGADFDHCVTGSGSFTPLAAEALGYAETYGEISPSGDGVHFLGRGKLDKSIVRDDLGFELYQHGRYFTVTGQRLEDAPEAIGEAPKLIARGMYARHLFGWPIEPDYRPLTDEADEVDTDLQECLMRLIDMPAGEGVEIEPRVIPLDPAAREAFEAAVSRPRASSPPSRRSPISELSSRPLMLGAGSSAGSA